MTNIQTYAVNCNDAWPLCKDDATEGTYVKYEDYEDLQRCMFDLVAIVESCDPNYCMCGDRMDNHTIGGCSSPVSMLDYFYNDWKQKNSEASE